MFAGLSGYGAANGRLNPVQKPNWRKESDKKMDTKKIMATFAILMMTLGIAGFAYAHWEKIVTVDGTIKTGTLHVIPSFHVEYTEAESKTVADIGANVYPDKNHIDVWFKNVYPCLRVEGYIDLENTGTIPVHLIDIKITATPTLSAVWNNVANYYEIKDETTIIATGNYKYDFPQGTTPDPYQIDPNGKAYINFWIHFEEGLPKDTEYSFHIDLTFWNWNESP